MRSLYKTGKDRPPKSRARVKAHGGMKNLLVDGRWAFVTQFASGHKASVEALKARPATLWDKLIFAVLGASVSAIFALVIK